MDNQTQQVPGPQAAGNIRQLVSPKDVAMKQQLESKMRFLREQMQQSQMQGGDNGGNQQLMAEFQRAQQHYTQLIYLIQQQLQKKQESPQLAGAQLVGSGAGTPVVTREEPDNSNNDGLETAIPEGSSRELSVKGSGQDAAGDAAANAEAMKKKQTLQIQTELFKTTLSQYLESQGKGLDPAAMLVNGKEVNMFVLYFIVNRMGGFQAVSNANLWGSVCQRLNVGVTAANVGAASSQLYTIYQEYLQSFEGYLKTPEGSQRLEHNKQKKLQEMQRQSQLRPGSQPVTAQSTGGSSVGDVAKSQLPKAVANSLPLVTSAKAATPDVGNPEQENEDPVYIRKYDPVVRNYAGVHAGHLLKKALVGGEQVESLKPSYLFPPEIGKLSIHSLIMALQTDSLSEINNTLNMLLVITADHRSEIVLRDCPELIDRISQLGLFVLDELIYNDLEKDGDAVPGSIYKRSHKVCKPGRKNFKSQSLNVANYDRVTTYEKYYSDTIDGIFERLNTEFGKDLTFTVDSFTGKLVPDAPVEHTASTPHQEAPSVRLFDDYVKKYKVFKFDRKQEYEHYDFLAKVKKFGLPSYMDMLLDIHQEMQTPFSEANVPSAENYKIMLVDQLVTISMVLRNLSFAETNKPFLDQNHYLKKFIFKLLFSCFAFDDRFVYARRKMILMKDSLMVLMNIGQTLKLTGFNDALCVVLLALQFSGPTTNAKDCLDSLILEYVPGVQKYETYAIDMLTKVLVNSPENRFLIKCVVTGVYKRPNKLFKTFNAFQSNTSGDDTKEDEDEDDQIHDSYFFENLGLVAENQELEDNITFELTRLYLNQSPKAGGLLERLFGFFLSALPFNTQISGTLEVEERASAILQSLLAGNLLAKMIPVSKAGEPNIALNWLSSQESIGSNLLRMGFIFAGSNRNEPGKDFLALISKRCFSMLNILLSKTFRSLASDTTKQQLSKLVEIPKIFPALNTILGSLLAQTMDGTILKEILKVAHYSTKVHEYLIEEYSQS